MNIAIFSSHGGSNFQNLVEYCQSQIAAPQAELLICNNQGAYVLERAKKLGVQALVVSSKVFATDKDQERAILSALKEHKIDGIALAGYMKKIPDSVLNLYPQKIINIHPSLLPKYGGKGMYGDRVFKAILENKENKSGVTVHYVNEVYDEGEVVLQQSFLLDKNETLESLKAKTQAVEKELYPKALQQVFQTFVSK